MQALLVIHNLLRWLILIFAIWTVLKALSGLARNRQYTKSDGQSNFFFMLSMDIQLLVGLALFSVGSWFERLKDLGANMKDPNIRFFTLEHELLMIIAWTLVHVGRVSVKKAATPRAKFKRTLIFFGIALVLILLGMPWPFREAISRPWFRGF